MEEIVEMNSIESRINNPLVSGAEETKFESGLPANGELAIVDLKGKEIKVINTQRFMRMVLQPPDEYTPTNIYELVMGEKDYDFHEVQRIEAQSIQKKEKVKDARASRNSVIQAASVPLFKSQVSSISMAEINVARKKLDDEEKKEEKAKKELKKNKLPYNFSDFNGYDKKQTKMLKAHKLNLTKGTPLEYVLDSGIEPHSSLAGNVIRLHKDIQDYIDNSSKPEQVSSFQSVATATAISVALINVRFSACDSNRLWPSFSILTFALLLSALSIVYELGQRRKTTVLIALREPIQNYLSSFKPPYVFEIVVQNWKRAKYCEFIEPKIEISKQVVKVVVILSTALIAVAQVLTGDCVTLLPESDGM